MQSFNPSNDTLTSRIRMEHYRLQCVELWPDSPHKQAVIASIHSALESLANAATGLVELPRCMVCNERRTRLELLTFPSKSKATTDIMRRAA